MAVSIAAFAFLWRYGLEPPAFAASKATPFSGIPGSAMPRPGKPVERTGGILKASRWIVVAMAAAIAADYAYYAVGWFPVLLPRYAGSGHALSIRILLPLVLLAIVSYGFVAVRLIRRRNSRGALHTADTDEWCKDAG